MSTLHRISLFVAVLVTLLGTMTVAGIALAVASGQAWWALLGPTAGLFALAGYAAAGARL